MKNSTSYLPISEAKRRLPLPKLLERLGEGELAKKSARCPFHEDRNNSFSVFQDRQGRWLWKCHAGCGCGDEISFIEKHQNLNRKNAITAYLKEAK